MSETLSLTVGRDGAALLDAAGSAWRQGSEFLHAGAAWELTQLDIELSANGDLIGGCIEAVTSRRLPRTGSL